MRRNRGRRPGLCPRRGRGRGNGRGHVRRRLRGDGLRGRRVRGGRRGVTTGRRWRRRGAQGREEDGGSRFTLNGKKPWGDGSDVNGRPNWMNAVPDAANNPRVRITFSLDGLLDEEGNEFATAQEAFDQTLPRGRALAGADWQRAQKSGNQTAWELGSWPVRSSWGAGSGRP
ncbi:polymorphic toxin type 27 domain-containing protein [Streptomyces sp. NPDC004237]|uniref:polymorphic toxin type 27 domain-containing protein n=1 Tax=Streptomyces sp. NPDC004237 TaxID=3154455 RepID=UPI0033B6C902